MWEHIHRTFGEGVKKVVPSAKGLGGCNNSNFSYRLTCEGGILDKLLNWEWGLWTVKSHRQSSEGALEAQWTSQVVSELEADRGRRSRESKDPWAAGIELSCWLQCCYLKCVLLQVLATALAIQLPAHTLGGRQKQIAQVLGFLHPVERSRLLAFAWPNFVNCSHLERDLAEGRSLSIFITLPFT